ncbi:acylglycerol lipase [Burkholderiales bacterium]|nr:acylglycerol lipase [Burkholderiales bacterium]
MLAPDGGVSLAAERWVPAGDARAHVVFAHGLGEHHRARPYVPFFETLAANGYATLAFDLRGHGLSEGPRLYARDFAILVRDLARVVALAADDARGRPVFIVGGSLGGLLAIAAALDPHDSLAGIVAGAPALDAGGTSTMMRRLLRLLALLAPRTRLDPGIEIGAIARDPDELAAWLDDPLMQVGRITPRLAVAILAGIELVMHRADDLALPMLLLHGQADRVVPADGSIALHALAGARDKTLKTYPGAFHHLLLDDARDEATRDIIAWLDRRT